MQPVVDLEVATDVGLVEALEDNKDDDHVQDEEKHDAACEFEQNLPPQSHVIPVE